LRSFGVHDHDGCHRDKKHDHCVSGGRVLQYCDVGGPSFHELHFDINQGEQGDVHRHQQPSQLVEQHLQQC